MKREVLNVKVMTCGGCVDRVTRALTALPGIAAVSVSLPKKQVEVQFDEIRVTIASMRAALHEAGYSLVEQPLVTPMHRGCCS